MGSWPWTVCRFAVAEPGYIAFSLSFLSSMKTRWKIFKSGKCHDVGDYSEEFQAGWSRVSPVELYNSLESIAHLGGTHSRVKESSAGCIIARESRKDHIWGVRLVVWDSLLHWVQHKCCVRVMMAFQHLCVESVQSTRWSFRWKSEPEANGPDLSHFLLANAGDAWVSFLRIFRDSS